MQNHASYARRIAARFLVVVLTAFGLAVSGLVLPAVLPADGSSEHEADKVARKVAKARGSAHQARAERDALQQFQENVEDYAELHTRQLAKLGPLEAPLAMPQALARAIQAKRARAVPGDIFEPEIQPILRRLIAEQLVGPGALSARKTILEGNPGEEEDSPAIELRVNAEYPLGAPRSTVPASVLVTLPPLPESLHYRFVGRDLILVDSVAQLIVDLLPAAMPDLAVP